MSVQKSSVWDDFLSQFPITTDESAKQYLKKAYDFASRRSDDPRTQIGAVIVSGNSQIYGTNKIPGAIKLLDWRIDSQHKADYVIHAETAAVCSSAFHGVRTAAKTMYAPWACCSKCSHAIIAAGIACLVVHNEIMMRTADRWQETMRIGLTNCLEAGIRIQRYDGRLNVSVLFDGEKKTF